jgi:tRNA(Ile)-lysidine synthase
VQRGALAVARADLRRYDAQGLGVVWPALAARAGVVLDRRGTRRLTEFTMRGVAGGRVQLSGGLEVVLHREQLLLRRAPDGPASPPAAGARPLAEGTVLGAWRFRRGAGDAGHVFSATLPADAPLAVREWQPGDRMLPFGSAVPRRAKGLFRDAGVEAGRRRGWPVVLAGGEIVWIPGVRRSGAAAARSGRPTEIWICERISERDDG